MAQVLCTGADQTCAAKYRGVVSPLMRACGSALHGADRSSLTAAVWLTSAAVWSGVLPVVLVASTLAPREQRSEMMPKLPICNQPRGDQLIRV